MIDFSLRCSFALTVFLSFPHVLIPVSSVSGKTKGFFGLPIPSLPFIIYSVIVVILWGSQGFCPMCSNPVLLLDYYIGYNQHGLIVFFCLLIFDYFSSTYVSNVGSCNFFVSRPENVLDNVTTPRRVTIK